MDPKEKEMEALLRVISDTYLHNHSWESAGDWADDEAVDDDEEVASDEDGWLEDWEDPNDDDATDHEAIAIRLMDALTENNLDSYVLLKDLVIAEWWGNIVRARNYQAKKRRLAEEAKRKKAEDARAKAELLSRLTPEEKRLLGLK